MTSQEDLQKIKILFLTTNLGTGGAETMLLNFLERIDRKVFQPYVISLISIDKIGEKIRNLGVPVFAMELNPASVNPFPILRFLKQVRKIKPEIIQGWMYHGNLFSLIGNWTLRKKALLFWSIHHSVYSLKNEKKLTALLIRLSARFSSKVNKIHYVAEESAKLHKIIGFCEDNAILIPNGFDTDKFKPDSHAKIQLRNELSITDGSLLVGLVARYHPMKDHKNLIQAAKIVKDRIPKVKFLLVGNDIDEKNIELNKLIDQYDLKNHVILLGVREDIPKIVAALDVAVNCSYSESFPLAVGEAMAAGVPCVVTDTGACGWVVDNTGRVVPVKDSPALAEGILELLSLEPNERANLGEKARERVQENFALNKIVKKFENLYLDAVKEKNETVNPSNSTD